MLRPFFYSSLLLVFAVFNAGCSSPQEPGASTTEAAKVASVVVRGPGTRVDSLNGIPGHQFGDPLNTFPGLELLPTNEPGLKTYTYPYGYKKPIGGWFGKRHQENPGAYTLYYTFHDGKFVYFGCRAVGEARDKLNEQATYLFGAGKNFGNGPIWQGEKAVAWYTYEQSFSGQVHMLNVKSQAFIRYQEKLKADQLKKDNEM